jgi:hypothetical protein
VTPHAPQLAALERSASHPFTGFPSQSARPRVQASMTHVPEEQSSEASGRSHDAPQAPQSEIVSMRRSQPFMGLPSQSARSVMQVYSHAPESHEAIAPGRIHRFVQLPHLSGSSSGASHPLIAEPSQSPKPSSHLKRQLPPTHSLVAFGRSGHRASQAPQLVTSVRVSTQPPAGQSVHGASQVGTQVGMDPSPEQKGVSPSQAALQAPQFAEVSRGVSHPLSIISSQSPKRKSQPEMHSPSSQTNPPLAGSGGQALSQLPQWFRSLSRSKPSSVRSSQSSSLPLHSSAAATQGPSGGTKESATASIEPSARGSRALLSTEHPQKSTGTRNELGSQRHTWAL